MKKTKKIGILFLLVAISQLIAPIKMIYDQEKTLEIEKPYKFLHGSHCNICWVQQRTKVYVFQRILDEVGIS